MYVTHPPTMPTSILRRSLRSPFKHRFIILLRSALRHLNIGWRRKVIRSHIHRCYPNLTFNEIHSYEQPGISAFKHFKSQQIQVVTKRDGRQRTSTFLLVAIQRLLFTRGGNIHHPVLHFAITSKSPEYSGADIYVLMTSSEWESHSSDHPPSF